MNEISTNTKSNPTIDNSDGLVFFAGVNTSLDAPYSGWKRDAW